MERGMDRILKVRREMYGWRQKGGEKEREERMDRGKLKEEAERKDTRGNTRIDQRW